MVQCSQARARKRISARSARGRASGGLEVIIPWRREAAPTKPHLLRFCMVQCSQARARKRISARSARGRASGGLEVIIPWRPKPGTRQILRKGILFRVDFLKKGVDIGRISSYNNKALRRYAVNAMRNCVMVAPATLTRIVRVRILLPQPNGSICCRFLSGYSAVGSALRSGRRGLEFKSQYSDHSENRTRQPKTA